ncbi:MAG: hypothetical protein IT494_01235 [Gammaproteobacteria bacterium]|nr:hypothetical protein [Gammaproteobacteria bacterium]
MGSTDWLLCCGCLWSLPSGQNRRRDVYTRQRAPAAMQAIRHTEQFPGETRVVNLEADDRAFLRKIEQVAGARLSRP